jgi:hypothetical protein
VTGSPRLRFWPAAVTASTVASAAVASAAVASAVGARPFASASSSPLAIGVAELSSRVASEVGASAGATGRFQWSTNGTTLVDCGDV